MTHTYIPSIAKVMLVLWLIWHIKLNVKYMTMVSICTIYGKDVVLPFAESIKLLIIFNVSLYILL